MPRKCKPDVSDNVCSLRALPLFRAGSVWRRLPNTGTCVVIICSCEQLHTYLTGRKNEAPRREAEVPGPVQLAHAAHVSGQGVLTSALVRPRKAVDSLAARQVSEDVGPVGARGCGRSLLPRKFRAALRTRAKLVWPGSPSLQQSPGV